MIPFIDLNRNQLKLHKLWLQKVEKHLLSSNFIGGKEVEILEKTLSELLKIKNVITCANGTDALQLSLRACNVSEGDKVVVQDNTFWATCESIFNVGAKPIIIDIEENYASIDTGLLEDTIARA